MTAIAEDSLQPQPYGLLITALAMAWLTFFAVLPLRRPRLLARVSFRSGLLVSEQPFYPFYLLAASFVLATVEGDLDTSIGRLALAIMAATCIGLAVIVVNSARTGGVVTRALDRGLGEGWHAASAVSGLRPRRLPIVRIITAPFLTGRRDVVQTRNISYGDAGRHNLLDVYRRRSRPSDRGVLIHLHGGGFAAGRKSFESRVLLTTLASDGWLCISANYRLRPAASFPDYLVDAKRVIAWARENAGSSGADAATVVMAGSSAGAHLAAMCALTPGRPEFQPGFESADTSVAAAVCLYGWYGRIWDDRGLSSPHDYLPPDDGVTVPPFFVAHGECDTFVPVEVARKFVRRLRSETDATVVFAELPRAQHTFDLAHSIRSDSVVRGVESFLAAVLAPVRR